jgi:uncharacterized LabA/DUF88 family protein
MDHIKIGIYVDSANINRNGGYSMRYDILRNYCARSGYPIRLNTYLPFDKERAETDIEYRNKQYGYYSVLRNFGYKVITKAVRWYYDDETRYGKANVDLDMAVDMLIQAKNLDKIFLLTGDGDFIKVVQAVQNMGVRVEIIAFKNISQSLIFESDYFTSGYLIPNLIPIPDQDPEDWAQIDYRVRAMVYAVNEGYGFLRYMDLDFNLREVFFHFSELPPNTYANLDDVFECTLTETPRGIQARELDHP